MKDLIFRSLLCFGCLYGSSVLSGCGSSGVTQTVREFTEKACACKDAACAKQVQADYLQWYKKNQRARGAEEDREEIEGLMERYSKCSMDLLAGEEVAPSAPIEPSVTPPALQQEAPLAPQP